MSNTKLADSAAVKAVPESDQQRTTESSRPNYRWAVALAFVVVVIDQLTKRWALDALQDPARDIDLIGSLRLNLVFNTGSAFSRGEGLGVWIALIAIAVVAVLVLVIRELPDPRVALPLAAIAGGAVGNLADRAFRGDGVFDGAVVDFIDLQWWPVFNIADAAIVVGGAWLVVFARKEPG